MSKGKLAMAAAGIILAALFGAWTLVGYQSTKGIETPAYEVTQRAKGYEIRQYAPQIRAEVILEGAYRESLYDGFRKLADYIFGNNKAQAEIAMTAPVLSEQSQKIAMTAPVLHTPGDDAQRHVIGFVMPSEYTLESLPKPNNPEVIIRQVSGGRYAAVRFRGYATERGAAKRIQRLKEALARDGVASAGEPVVAQYNPPWTPPYMRRNEILIPLD